MGAIINHHVFLIAMLKLATVQSQPSGQNLQLKCTLKSTHRYIDVHQSVIRKITSQR